MSNPSESSLELVSIEAGDKIEPNFDFLPNTLVSSNEREEGANVEPEELELELELVND